MFTGGRTCFLIYIERTAITAVTTRCPLCRTSPVISFFISNSRLCLCLTARSRGVSCNISHNHLHSHFNQLFLIFFNILSSKVFTFIIIHLELWIYPVIPISGWIKRIHVPSAQLPRPTYFPLGPAWRQLILQSISFIYSTHKKYFFVTTAHFVDLGPVTSAHFLYIVAFSDPTLTGLIYGIIWYNIVNKLHVYTNYYTNIFSYIYIFCFKKLTVVLAYQPIGIVQFYW